MDQKPHNPTSDGYDATPAQVEAMLDTKIKELESRMTKKFERSLLNVNVDIHDAFKPVLEMMDTKIHESAETQAEIVKRNM